MELQFDKPVDDKKVLYVNDSEIERIKRLANEVLQRINKFVDQWNVQHVGTPLLFTEKYTKALIRHRFQDVAGKDFHDYLIALPKFQQNSLNQLYKDHIESLYNEADRISNAYDFFVGGKFYEATKLTDLAPFLDISNDGKISLSNRFDELLKERFTYTTADVNPELVSKLEEYITLERDIQLLVGKYNFKNILGTQQLHEFNKELHAFDLTKLVVYVKKYNLDTYRTVEQQ